MNKLTLMIISLIIIAGCNPYLDPINYYTDEHYWECEYFLKYKRSEEVITDTIFEKVCEITTINLSKHNDDKFNELKSMTQANDSFYPLSAHCRRVD